jgi:hypothetical protein
MSYLDDPRVFLAAERTMLAWQRTAIAPYRGRPARSASRRIPYRSRFRRRSTSPPTSSRTVRPAGTRRVAIARNLPTPCTGWRDFETWWSMATRRSTRRSLPTSSPTGAATSSISSQRSASALKTRHGETMKCNCLKDLAERTGLEPATPGVTGRYSNRLNYRSFRAAACCCGAAGGC